MTTSEVTTLLLVSRGGPPASAVAEVVFAHAPVAIYASPEPSACDTAEVIAARCQLAVRIEDRLGGADDAALDALQRRMVAAAESVVRDHPGQCVALVAHERALYALLCRALSAPLREAQPFRIDPASMSVVEVGSDGLWTLLRLNERCHLPAV